MTILNQNSEALYQGSPHNRQERRKMMKKYPRYRQGVKDMSEKVFADLEKLFESKWAGNEMEDQESLDLRGEKGDEETIETTEY